MGSFADDRVICWHMGYIKGYIGVYGVMIKGYIGVSEVIIEGYIGSCRRMWGI